MEAVTVLGVVPSLFEISGAVSRMFRITESASGKYTVIWEGFSSVVSYNGEDQKPNAYIIVDGEKLDVTVALRNFNVAVVSEVKSVGRPGDVVIGKYFFVYGLNGACVGNNVVSATESRRKLGNGYRGKECRKLPLHRDKDGLYP